MEILELASKVVETSTWTKHVCSMERISRTSTSYAKQQSHDFTNETNYTGNRVRASNGMESPTPFLFCYANYPTQLVLQQTYSLQPPSRQRMESRAERGVTQSQISNGSQNVASAMPVEFVSKSHNNSVRRYIDTYCVRTSVYLEFMSISNDDSGWDS